MSVVKPPIGRIRDINQPVTTDIILVVNTDIKNHFELIDDTTNLKVNQSTVEFDIPDHHYPEENPLVHNIRTGYIVMEKKNFVARDEITKITDLDELIIEFDSVLPTLKMWFQNITNLRTDGRKIEFDCVTSFEEKTCSHVKCNGIIVRKQKIIENLGQLPENPEFNDIKIEIGLDPDRLLHEAFTKATNLKTDKTHIEFDVFQKDIFGDKTKDRWKHIECHGRIVSEFTKIFAKGCIYTPQSHFLNK
jgi:hypothetical protein